MRPARAALALALLALTGAGCAEAPPHESAAIELGTGSWRFEPLEDGQEVDIVIRPQHLKIDPDVGQGGPRPSAANGAPARGRVERARFMGSDSLIEVRMEHDGSVLRATVPSAWLPERGAGLWLSLRRDRCFVFPAA